MKIGRKITSLLLTFCVALILVPSVAYASSGRVSFTDLTSLAGAEFEIKIAVTSETEDLGEIYLELTYDDEAIQFLSGDGVTASDGILTYSATGSGNSTYTVMTFLALKYGDTMINIQDVSVKSSTGNEITVAEGYSAISVEGGTEVEASALLTTTGGDDVIVLDEISYTFSNKPFNSATPANYTETTVEYNGNTYYAAEGDTSGIFIVNFTDESGNDVVLCYEPSTVTFYPYVQVSISDSMYIVFQQSDIEETLPEQYAKTMLIVDSFEFPTWEDTANAGYYLIHAINSNGEDSIYQYDSTEETYQRVTLTTTDEEADVADGENGEESTFSILTMVLVVLLIAMALIVIILILKNNEKNNEIDDLYDELDELEESNKTLARAASKQLSSGKPKQKSTTSMSGKAPSKPQGGMTSASKSATTSPSRPTSSINGKAPTKAPNMMAESNRMTQEEIDQLPRQISKRPAPSKVVPQKPETLRRDEKDFETKVMKGYGDDFEEQFMRDYKKEFKSDLDLKHDSKFDTNFEVTLSDQMIDDIEAPRKSIKSVASKRRESGSIEDEIDYLDI